jgi:hypothetical protein
MQTARALATLKLLPDGKVQIIGGDAELSMEVFDPVTGIFNAKALLPPNADLLAATLSTQSRAALFTPSISQDPLLQSVLTPDQLALLDRADQSITELPSRNQALVAGGINSAGQMLNSAKLVKSSSATITTDKNDYAPGEIVTITGSGFQPNEQVDIFFHEFPEEYPDIYLSAIANQQGNFVTAEFAPQEIDLGRIFTLTAIGQSSGFTAQTAFKDARSISIAFAGSGGGQVQISVSSGSVSFNTSGGSRCDTPPANGTGNNSALVTISGTCTSLSSSANGATVTVTAIPNGSSFFAGWSNAGGSFTSCNLSNAICSQVLAGGQNNLTVTFNATMATTLTLSAPSPASVPFGSSGPVILSANLTRTSGGAAVVGATINFKVDASSVGSAVTNSSGVASLTTYNPTVLSVGNHTVQASFTQQAISGTTYAASTSGNQTLTIAKTTPVITFGAAPTTTFGGGNFTVSATTTNTDSSALTYSQVSGPCALVSGATFSSSGAGTCVVRASGAETVNFLAASADQSLTIAKAPVTATAGGGSATYDVTTKSPSACVVSGTYTGNLTCANNPASVGPDAGTTTIVPVVNGTGLDNFEITPVNGSYTIDKATSITEVTCPASVVYNGSAQTPCTVSVTGAGGLNLTPAVNYSNNTNAGTATASYTFAETANHLGSSDSKSFEITKADAACSVTGYNVIYNGNPHTATGSCTGVLRETLSGLDLSNTSHTNAGTYNDPWTFTDSTGNYNNTSGTVTDFINKANATINVSGFTGVYDGLSHGATGSATGVMGENLSAWLNLGAMFTNVPGGTAYWTFTGGTNYNDATGNVPIVINKRPASVTPDDASKLLGALDPVPLTTGTLSGFILADGVTATYTRTPGETAGTYTISAALSPAGVLGNYNITYNTANFTITYGVCLLFDNNKAVQKNATIPIKLNLCDANAVNVSSSGVVLNAFNLVWWGAESAPDVQDSGNANPDNNFRYTGGSYMFNLSTKNLWSGKWGLEFKADGDPLSHLVIFNVR